MHPSTIATLDELRRAHWFSKVGVVDEPGCKVLSSWEEAIASCTSPDWLDLCLEVSNRFREHLVERSHQRFQQWNKICEEVDPVVWALVREKTRAVVEKHKLPEVFQKIVFWDMLYIVMECEYADVYPPGFYVSQGYWYVKGHFPCGWEGPIPDGRLIIY